MTELLGEAERVDVWGETVLVVRLRGEDRVPVNALRLWQELRAELVEGYPVLVSDVAAVVEPDYRHDVAPGELIARAQAMDLDARVADGRRWLDDPGVLGTPGDDYFLEGYDIEGWGDVEAVVVVPRPEPWAVFAYLAPYPGNGSLVVAAARRWYERFGAAPTLVGPATGFEVAKRPAGPVEAIELAFEHVVVAGLTAGNTLHGYARSLLELDHWCLYDRP